MEIRIRTTLVSALHRLHCQQLGHHVPRQVDFNSRLC